MGYYLGVGLIFVKIWYVDGWTTFKWSSSGILKEHVRQEETLLEVSMFVRLSACLSLCPSICLSVCFFLAAPSVCLSVRLLLFANKKLNLVAQICPLC